MIRIFAIITIFAFLISCAEKEPASVEFELEEITVSELNEAYANGKYSSQQVVEQYLARIDALNKKGPHLNAVIAVNPDALKIAEALDEERSQNGPRSPMHGIPVLLKDNIDTKDNMPTTAG